MTHDAKASQPFLFQFFRLVYCFTLLFGLFFMVVAPCWPADSFGVPVSGTLTSPFGWRVDPFTGQSRFHSGIDIAAPYNTPIYAPQGGQVVYTGPYGGYGNVVVLSHPNGLFSLYGHTAFAYVQTGQTIIAGDAIAAVGSTGRSTGPHLHFEVYEPTQYLNPLEYLSSIGNGQTIAARQTPRRIASRTSYATAAVASNRHKTHHNPWRVELVKGNNVEVVEF